MNKSLDRKKIRRAIKAQKWAHIPRVLTTSEKKFRRQQDYLLKKGVVA